MFDLVDRLLAAPARSRRRRGSTAAGLRPAADADPGPIRPQPHLPGRPRSARPAGAGRGVGLHPAARDDARHRSGGAEGAGAARRSVLFRHARRAARRRPVLHGRRRLAGRSADRRRQRIVLARRAGGGSTRPRPGPRDRARAVPGRRDCARRLHRRGPAPGRRVAAAPVRDGVRDAGRIAPRPAPGGGRAR